MMLLANSLLFPFSVSCADTSEKEVWTVHPNFHNYKCKTVAVVPMDNLSLEPIIEEALFNETYDRLVAKGYMKVSVDHVRLVMKKLGIFTPGQLAGISLKKLGNELNCDALLIGQIEQSAAIHAGVYDAVTVSCSLRLLHIESGVILWQAEQWRTAHRQWQFDPVNALINAIAHESSSRGKRIAWLVQEMLSTLPQGPVIVEHESFLEKAQEVTIKNE